MRGWNILEFKMVLCCVSHHGVVQIWIAQILFILCMNKDSELVDCCDLLTFLELHMGTFSAAETAMHLKSLGNTDN